jgi:hypothetical protein
MYLKSINGLEGVITIPSIGATIGNTSKWTLSRRDDRHGPLGVYVFQAAFSYLNTQLWSEPSLRKEIRVRLGQNGQWYRVEQVEGTPYNQVSDNQFTMEEVTLWQLEED